MGVGCGHMFQTTFEKEVSSDLTGERCVLHRGNNTRKAEGKPDHFVCQQGFSSVFVLVGGGGLQNRVLEPVRLRDLFGRPLRYDQGLHSKPLGKKRCQQALNGLQSVNTESDVIILPSFLSFPSFSNLWS